MYVCAVVTSQGLRCRRQMNSSNFKADSACSAIHQSHEFLISVEADQLLHMEWVTGNNIEKWAMNKRKSWNWRLGAKKKSNVSYLELLYKDDIDQTRVLCQQCLASVATTRGNTTNKFNHLSWYHTAQYDECKARSDCRPKHKNRCQSWIKG